MLPARRLRPFSSLLFRLCLLVVAAFGSRPRGVVESEQTRAPLIVGLRAHHAGDADERLYSPIAASLASPARGVASLRTSTAAIGGGPGLPVFEASASARSLGVAHKSVVPVPRRAPCAGCGDGNPYDATAPPRSGIV